MSHTFALMTSNKWEYFHTALCGRIENNLVAAIIGYRILCKKQIFLNL